MIHALKPTTVLANRIARIYPSLSAGHRRIADHVLSFPLESATASIEVLAERSGASNATVTRFVRALGYSSYGEFRVALSDALRLAMQPVDDFADARAMTESASGTFIAALRMQRANIEKAMNSSTRTASPGSSPPSSPPAGSSSSPREPATTSPASSRTAWLSIARPTSSSPRRGAGRSGRSGISTRPGPAT